jgi:haloalkane dehalogenase
VETPEKFERIVILNTWLHHGGFEYSKAIREWRSAATNRQWLAWTRHNLPCGAIVRRALTRAPQKPGHIEAAYEAPFHGNAKSKAGARRFPWCIPFAEPEAGSAMRQANAFENLKTWKGPIHFIFGANDPIFPPSWGRRWSSLVPSSSFDIIENAGHFCQEDAGEEIVSQFLELCKKRPI